jgi:lipopolysaccharide transport system permease protein
LALPGELFAFLAWRDVLVRYRQTVIGVTWALLRPFLTMVVFSLVFGKLAKLPSEGLPYPLLVFAGMLPWQFFANSLSESSSALIANASMISKVYFPRGVLPVSAVVVAFVEFLISFVLLGAMMAWYRFVPAWRAVALPGLMLIAIAAALGPGFLLAALNVRYREVIT